jgi:hypothetical protein
LNTLGTGKLWYESSQLRGEGHAHWIHLYDPQSLASVATGAKRQDQIQAASRWQIKFPGLPDPLPGWNDQPIWTVLGTSFDATTNRLYVCVRFGAPTNAIPSSSHAIHVYQVS